MLAQFGDLQFRTKKNHPQNRNLSGVISPAGNTLGSRATSTLEVQIAKSSVTGWVAATKQQSCQPISFFHGYELIACIGGHRRPNLYKQRSRGA